MRGGKQRERRIGEGSKGERRMARILMGGRTRRYSEGETRI
jgi:hypothetical protein